MPELLPLFQWLEDTSVATAVVETTWMFPSLEIVHLLGMISFVGTIGTFDLRLLGLWMRDRPVSQLAGRLLPIAWACFSVMAASGSLLFSSRATEIYVNAAFRFKLLLLILAGVNVLVFHITVYRRVARWDEAHATPLTAKLAGGISLLIWVGVVAAGRMIAYM